MISTNHLLVDLVAALASASAYGGTEDSARNAQLAAQASVGQDMRTAQVELYCDHDAQALLAIRRARAALEASHDTAAAQALIALDQASWHVRHKHMDAALEALNSARSGLAG